MRVGIVTWHRLRPVRTGHALRVMSIAHMYAAQFEVKLVAVTHKPEPSFSFDGTFDGFRLQQRGFGESYRQRSYDLACFGNGYPGFYPRHFADFVRNELKACDVVQIESLRLARLFLDDRRPLILDEHNVEWERLDFGCSERRRLMQPLWSRTSRAFEKRVIKGADLVLATSDRDRRIISSAVSDCQTDRLMVVPNCIDVDRYDQSDEENPYETVPGRPRPVVAFTGNLSYFPNMDAVRVILSRIAPAVPEAWFVIVGGGMPEAPRLRPPNVSFTGYVENIRPYIRFADICICPLRYGGGTRLKLLEFFALRTPTISTTKGAEGLNVRPNHDLIVEDDPDRFATAIRRLLADQALCLRLSAAARQTVSQWYDWRRYSEPLCERVNELVSEKSQVSV